MLTSTPVFSFKVTQDKVTIRLKNRVCDTAEELLASDLFLEIVKRAVADLTRRNSILLKIFGNVAAGDAEINSLVQTLQFLSKMQGHHVLKLVPGSEVFLRDKNLLNDFVEFLYNFWRHFNRFIVCDSEGEEMDKRPFRTFNETVENLTHLVRKVYRDVQENIMETHPRIYRQVSAGAEFAAIALAKDIPFPDPLYSKLRVIPIIRQILM